VLKFLKQPQAHFYSETFTYELPENYTEVDVILENLDIVAFVTETRQEIISGKVVGDIMMMRGTFENPLIGDGKFILKGILPVSTSIDYPIKLSSRSGGKAKITTHFAGYRKCSDEEGVIRKISGNQSFG